MLGVEQRGESWAATRWREGVMSSHWPRVHDREELERLLSPTVAAPPPALMMSPPLMRVITGRADGGNGAAGCERCDAYPPTAASS